MSEGIAEWFEGKNVFVTGGTGFMGKVLLEKLLRCCPGIGKIYVLCRQKKGLSPASRVTQFSNIPLFERLKKERPEALKKLVVVEGDVTLHGLGLLSDVKERLRAEVSVVFNMAASLRLEAGIKVAIAHNTASTLRALELARTMPNLEIFVHLSTAFCHCEVDVLEERIYQSPANPREIIETMEWMDENVAEAITPSLLGPQPNCYTYSKRLSEALVAEYSNTMPVLILRPSIVTPTIQEPMPGWVDNLNGPVGILIGAGKGVIRSMLCHPDNRAEVIPVDIAINAIIAATWRRATNKETNGEVPVFNISVGEKEPMSWGELVIRGRDIITKYPFEAGLWYPNGTIRTNVFVHTLVVFFLQTVPAYLIDFLMMLARQKRFMVRIQNRIAVGMSVLQFFTMRPWTFRTGKVLALEEIMNDRDKKTFYLSNVDYDLEEYLVNVVLGSRVYCLKEPLESLPKARKQLQWLYWLDLITKTVFSLTMSYLAVKYFMMFKTFYEGAKNGYQLFPVLETN